MIALSLLFQLLLFAPPRAEISAAAQQALAQVIDDQPLAGDAGLDALVDEVAKWTETGGWPAPDLSAIAASPAPFRGESFHLATGPATRIASSAFDIKYLSAWQTTSPTISEPLLLLVYEPDGTAASGDHVESIDLPACFYKTAMASMHLAGLPVAAPGDPSTRPPQRILVFVGAVPKFSAAATGSALAWGNLFAALVVGGVVLLIVRRYALKRAAGRPLVVIGEAPHEAWNDANLPEAPAEALAELRRRGGDTMNHD